ncbi:DNA replication/repair protein RecF [Nibricoccus sp. IMCC34717]|uniref:DNA replication/repair protein RecF n=1 Tax=Nibricoccus sp. IMCC34717 TaxID=3034021 RepID=UPI00384AC0DE
MRLAKLTLQNFRNFAWAELELNERQLFLVGRNGQGKTNILEAIGFATALRSFRTSDARDLIGHGAAEASVAWEWRSAEASERVVATIRPGAKELRVEGERVARVGDYLGKFPTVVFSSLDIQLVRGGAIVRRRWMDSLLATASPAYLHALQGYTRALEARNRLLRTGATDSECAAFEAQMAEAAQALCTWRAEAEPRLGTAVAAACAGISDAGEPTAFTLRTRGQATTAEEWRQLWETQRARDRNTQATSHGPHRDDVDLLLDGRAARDFASEGQQRTLVLALRLAEAAYLETCTGRAPVILADDVLGELDAGRRTRFWATLGSERQVVATGTDLPGGGTGAWQILRVNGGKLEAAAP